jgi:hypothetical protein
MEKLKMQNLGSTSPNWKVLKDLLYVLPFVPAEKIVETYETEILGRIDEMKTLEENPFGSPAAERKVFAFLNNYLEKTWIGPRQGLHGRGPPLYEHRRWNHFFDCYSGDALTNNSSEGNCVFFGIIEVNKIYYLLTNYSSRRPRCSSRKSGSTSCARTMEASFHGHDAHCKDMISLIVMLNFSQFCKFKSSNAGQSVYANFTVRENYEE